MARQNSGLEFPAQVSGKYAHFFAVFCHSPACKLNAFLFEHVYDFAVAERFARVFAAYDFADFVLDRRSGCRVAGISSDRGGKKIFQLVQPARCLDIFVADCTADGRFVKPERTGDDLHGHRFEKCDALVEKAALAVYQFLRYVVDCLLSLMDVFYKPHA